MTINIGYDTYKFWNSGENKIEIASDTLKKMELPFTSKFIFNSYQALIDMIAIKHRISSEEVYKNRSTTEGFN